MTDRTQQVIQADERLGRDLARNVLRPLSAHGTPWFEHEHHGLNALVEHPRRVSENDSLRNGSLKEFWRLPSRTHDSSRACSFFRAGYMRQAFCCANRQHVFAPLVLPARAGRSLMGSLPDTFWLNGVNAWSR